MHCCDLQKSDFKTQTWPHEEGASNIRSGWHIKKKCSSEYKYKYTCQGFCSKDKLAFLYTNMPETLIKISK